MKVIDLTCTDFPPSLIVKCDSGVSYSNQTDGVMCRHPVVEGVLVPLTFWGFNYEMNELLEDYPTKEFVEGWIKKLGVPLKVSGKEPLSEAWIEVEILPHDDGYSPLKDFVGCKAILTYENSD